ncbi:unnamed protein product [Adineta ricciae]|uniref:TIR domain-containing protein n=1 Tax=Adineta ricciae TaxID=249248 RepID=A0A816ABZ4_ADIRI|nr:unnamed protein product [Adineta ricciae]CAF1593634.1 unnamed protein product [Adineta ricciae]
MAENPSDSIDNQIKISDNEPSASLREFREMVNIALNLDSTSTGNDDNLSIDEQGINQALLTLDGSSESSSIPSISTTTTAVSVAELPSGITDSLNVAAKQLSHLYDSVVSTTTTEPGEELNEGVNYREQGISDSFVEVYTEEDEDEVQSLSAIPKTTTGGSQPQKRHIMISYNRSSRDTCERIYQGLVNKNYKVWMDLTDMADDILVSMARAVENSYIVLLCINQQYYESDYCRLEAEYAAENRIKFIPCLMEKSFRAQSWLGIIKGSNFHIDFSSPEDFDESFNELVRQITHVEKKLSMQPRRTPAPGSMVNPMKFAATSSGPAATAASISANDVNSRRFDAIIREYKHAIKKKSHQLNRLKRNELADLISKLRQELFIETTQVLTDSERSDEEDEKQHNDDHLLQQLLSRSLDQNEFLLRLVDRLTTPQPMEQTNLQNLNMDGIFKVILAIMVLWALNILCQKE